MAMSNKADREPVPPTQVEPRATRRVFSIELKRTIVEQAAACSEPGEPGKLLRSHGLYSSHLVDWRRQYEAGDRQGYGRLRRGPLPQNKPLGSASCELQRRIEQLERKKQRLHLRAVKAEALVEFQKKRSAS